MIQGKTTIELNDASTMDALTRYLCEELKSPVVVTAFKRKDDGYSLKFLSVEFEPAPVADATKAGQ